MAPHYSLTMFFMGMENVWKEHFHTLCIGGYIILRNKYVINIPVNYRTIKYFFL